MLVRDGGSWPRQSVRVFRREGKTRKAAASRRRSAPRYRPGFLTFPGVARCRTPTQARFEDDSFAHPPDPWPGCSPTSARAYGPHDFKSASHPRSWTPAAPARGAKAAFSTSSTLATFPGRVEGQLQPLGPHHPAPPWTRAGRGVAVARRARFRRFSEAESRADARSPQSERARRFFDGRCSLMTTLPLRTVAAWTVFSPPSAALLGVP